MTAVSVLIPLWLVWTAGVLIPGPNFLAVTHAAASLFAVAVPQGAPQWITVAAFGLIVGTAWGWYSLCGIMASHHRVTASYKRFRTVLKRGAGADFVGFGAALALDSREF